MGEHIQVGDQKIWAEQAGSGPDVLLIGGFGDTVESWRNQFDGLAHRYRLTAFDNRGAGRTELVDEDFTVEALADDAAGVLQAFGISSAHIAGISGGSIIARELALRHPGFVRSLVLQNTWVRADACLHAFDRCLRWMVQTAPGEREFLEAFFLFSYSAKAHNDGTVEQLIDEVLNLPHKHRVGAVLRLIEALADHDGADRLQAIRVPTLVLAGGMDRILRPRLGREVAGRIPGARFEVVAEQGHRPIQEAADAWNARVDAFWRQIDQ